MKKVNKARQALLQRKRTKRNIARKGKTYDPNKLMGIHQRSDGSVSGQRAMAADSVSSDTITGETSLVL